MSTQTITPTPRDLALKRCQELIDKYGRLRERHRIAYHGLQVAAIALSGITPVLILWTGLPEVIKALPAALAAIATGVIGIFQWNESYPRCTYVCEALKSERVRFETRTTKAYTATLDDQQALNNFVTNMENIVLSEITDWRSETQKSVESRGNSTKV